MAHDVFVSHSSEDGDTASAAVHALEQRRIRCWVAPRDIPVGDDWTEAIMAAIGSASVMVLVFSSNANASPMVMREIRAAVERGVPILPLRIEDVAPSGSMEFFISGTHWLDAVTPPLERHLEILAGRVRALLAEPAGGPEADATPRPPPIAPVTLDLGPPRVPGLFGGRFAAASHDLTLRNGGDESLQLQLDADDDGGRCSFSFPDRVTVPPHGVTTVTIKVRPRAQRWRGDREIRWFSVMASSGDGGQPPTIVSDQYEDLPYGWLPYSVGAALGVPVAALVAAALLAGGGGGTPEPDPTQTAEATALTPTPGTQDSPSATATSPSPTPAPTSSPSATATAPVEDTAEPSMDLGTATALLDRAVAAKDLSNQGQVEAVEALLVQGYDFVGRDLSGISLAGAELSGGVFGGAALVGTDLSESGSRGADFTRADLSFANLNGADLTGANLNSIFADFADAESAVFADVDAPQL